MINRFKVDTTKVATVASRPARQPEKVSELDRLKREVYCLREQVAKLADTNSRYKADEEARNQRQEMGG